ncbi:zinc-binding dehydrogenase [Kitasatospora sp. NPDC005748]|uniref:zinc-binding dehydrogenase n=1 Tax=Kitasatospora sp. NPDC005748 TaxID=3157063 RepID=UPI0033E8728B
MRAGGDQLRGLAWLVDAGEIRPVVGRVFSFSQVRGAVWYAEKGRAGAGDVVIAMVWGPAAGRCHRPSHRGRRFAAGTCPWSRAASADVCAWSSRAAGCSPSGRHASRSRTWSNSSARAARTSKWGSGAHRLRSPMTYRRRLARLAATLSR